jgi:hypothetical protein
MASEQMCPQVARFRLRWRAHQHRLDRRRLILIDEAWIKAKVTPACGWVERRQAAHRACPAWAKEDPRLPGRAAPRPGSLPPFVPEGLFNGDPFSARVGRCHAPTLAAGDVVIADIPGSHKGHPARQVIDDAGAWRKAGTLIDAFTLQACQTCLRHAGHASA